MGNQEKPMLLTATGNTISVNACGLQCSGPVIKRYEAMTGSSGTNLFI